MNWNPWFLRARLKTRHLMLLSAIGEEGSICDAAETLSMSQPAASRLLRELEQTIGTELFERQARGVKANRYGEALIRHARNALSSLTEAAVEIDSLRSGRTGQVRVGCIGAPAVGIVPRAVARVARDYPLVRVQVSVDTNDRLLVLLGDGRIDLMVGRLPVEQEARFSFDRLAEEPVCVVARKDHPLRSRPCGIADVVDASWVVPPAGSLLREKFVLMFRERGLVCPGRLVETDSPMIVTRLLQETDFLAVLPRSLARYYVDFGLIGDVPLELPCSLGPFGVIARKGWLQSPAALLMHEALEDEAQRSSRGQPATDSVTEA
jgi:DNA-binding transcriptional LysR family regulator